MFAARSQLQQYVNETEDCSMRMVQHMRRHDMLALIRPCQRLKGQYDSVFHLSCGSCLVQLKSHKVAHEEKTHRCSMCDYTAARKSNLDAHVKAQHSGVQYKCEDCGYHTGYYANLCKHQRLTCGRSRNYQHTNSVNASSSGSSFNAFLTHGNVF